MEHSVFNPCVLPGCADSSAGSTDTILSSSFVSSEQVVTCTYKENRLKVSKLKHSESAHDLRDFNNK
jgi:hypothetical protein